MNIDFFLFDVHEAEMKNTVKKNAHVRFEKAI